MATPEEAQKQRELQEKLSQVANRLLEPPSLANQLLPILDETESLLTQVEQSPEKVMHDILSPLIKALVADELLRHSNVDVKVALASCLSEIARITAPEAPYDDEKMKAVFQLIVSSFENLYDTSSDSFNRRATIVHTVSKVRLCVVMLDLECDELISEMFQHFLKAIREDHPSHIFSSMEAIMTLVIEESEDVSMDLVTKLLANVKKDEEIKPVTKRLAESVFAKCAEKLKPYVSHAVKSMGISLNDYSNVVTSVLEGTRVDVEHNNDTSKELSCVESKLASSGGRDQATEVVENKPSIVSSDVLDQNIADIKQEACSKDDHQTVNMSPKSVTSSGVNGGNSAEAESLANTGDNGPCDQTDIVKAEPKSDSNDLQASSMKSDVKKNDRTAKEQEKESNTKTSLAESLDRSPVHEEKMPEKVSDGQKCQRDADGSTDESPAENHPDEQKSRDEDNDSSPADDAAVGADKPLAEKKTTTAQVSPHKASEDETTKFASSQPSQSHPNETDEEEPIKSKENDSLVQEESVSTEVASKKQSEGASDSEAQPEEEPDIRVQSETSHEDEAGSMSDAEVKKLKPKGKKAVASKTKGSSSKNTTKKRKGNLKRHGRGKANMEIDVPKSSAKDDSDKMVSSQESPQKSAEDDIKGGNQRKSTKRKQPSGKEKAPEKPGILYDGSLVGTKIKVWWPLDVKYYAGVIESYDPSKRKHKVLYTDGEVEELDLREEKWKLDRDILNEESEDADEPSSPDASARIGKSKKTRRQAETSSKNVSNVSSKSSGAKSQDTATKSSRKSADPEPKSKNSSVKSGGKSKDTSGNKSKNDSERSSGKLKDMISSSSPRSKSASKSQQETSTKSNPKSKGKAPQSSGKASANGGKTKSGALKRKESEDLKEKSQEPTKGKASSASKEQEIESKSGKKRKKK